MLTILAITLVLGQNGLTHMAQAVPHVTIDYLVGTRLQATDMAHQLLGNPRLMNLAIYSHNPRHRMAAAFAFGIALEPDERLFDLACDHAPIVPQSAREALIHIAATKFGKRLDYGPRPGACLTERETSARLWREWFHGFTTNKPDEPWPNVPMRTPPQKPDEENKAPNHSNVQEPEKEDYDSPLPTDGFDPSWLIVRLSLLGLGLAGTRFAKDCFA